ncbi:alpha-ketoglutarate decarboxylase [Maribacter litopenaei]|uniref:Alpha-ketoglutarate decarboxylase n=1 Tax=Maribacter litopenaei TaxID=2976127 RepID=A0ABY5Y8V8_9FLAO|nr:alpha-ketoglutarate decarboxylase [Maribacter litopenaei]UWX55453.1 alpha-ketoglutarate decarboxylase [Maribacter litopenaei]
MIKKIIFTCFISLLTHMTFAQYFDNNSNFLNRVRFGGSLGLGFFNGGFNASVSPSAIYPFTNEFSAGASLNFNYAKFNDDKLLAYGGSIISLYNPIPELQLSAEFEQLRINRTYEAIPNYIEDNYWSPALFIGAGYSSYNVTVGLRYNLLYRENESIYANALLPFIRVYF